MKRRRDAATFISISSPVSFFCFSVEWGPVHINRRAKVFSYWTPFIIETDAKSFGLGFLGCFFFFVVVEIK